MLLKLFIMDKYTLKVASKFHILYTLEIYIKKLKIFGDVEKRNQITLPNYIWQTRLARLDLCVLPQMNLYKSFHHT